MKFYTKITLWENQRRLRILFEFRNIVNTYFDNSRIEWASGEQIEDVDAQRARVKINRTMSEVYSVILHSRMNPSVRWTPPPIVGGYVQDVDLILDLFHIHRLQISPKNVLDFIDRVIGTYENNYVRAIVRTFNPLFYIGLILDWIASLPFVLINKIGFNSAKVESSIIGKLLKGFLYVVTATASILTILHLLNYLESVKQFIEHIFVSK